MDVSCASFGNPSELCLPAHTATRSKTGDREGLGTRLMGGGKEDRWKQEEERCREEREWWEEERSVRIEGGGGSVLCESVHILRHSWEGHLKCSAMYCTYGYVFYC